MSSYHEDQDGRPNRRQSIPLQDLDNSQYNGFETESVTSGQFQYGQSSQNPSQRPPNLPSISTYWEQPYDARHDEVSPSSPLDLTALQAALPPDVQSSIPPSNSMPSTPIQAYAFDHRTPYVEDAPSTEDAESDRVPLTASAETFGAALSTNMHGERVRDSLQTVSSLENNPSRGRNMRSLGQDLDPNFRSSRHRSYGASLDPKDYRRSRSPSTSGALSRAGSIVRAMSQRVVNISGESEIIDQRTSRHHSRSRSPNRPEGNGLHDAPNSMLVDTSYQPQLLRRASAEKAGQSQYLEAEAPLPDLPRTPLPNPLKGKSLGIFSPDNPLRVKFCDLLVNPYTEPILLLLLVLQAILLAVESASDVFADGNGRPEKWAGNGIDWAMLALFIIFTLELMARIIVSGFILNAAEYSTIDRKRGVRAAIADQYRTVFQPERQKSVKKSSFHAEPSAISRSLTTFMQGQQALPRTVEEQQRFQLARRAFLRHSFNRIDFVAVCSFWITFLLSITGLETRHNLYVFRMMSCLRILRLLALTNGTAVSLCMIIVVKLDTYCLLDHPSKSEEGGTSAGPGCLSVNLLLVTLCYHRSAEFQGQSESSLCLA